MKIYRLHDPKGKFLCELNTLDNCKKIAEALFNSPILEIDCGYIDDEDLYIIEVLIIKATTAEYQ